MDITGTLFVVVLTTLVYGSGAFLLNTTATTKAPIVHHYAWAAWDSWSTCDVDCTKVATHTYTHTRTRTCKDGATAVTYRHCGSHASTRQTQNCPVNCPEWSAWSMWSNCSATCDGGSIIRVRHCGTGQTSCPGSAFEMNTCGTLACPVDGDWGAWVAWSSCSHTCGAATQTRHRACNSPAPQHGGAACPGQGSETQSCSLAKCVIDGGWAHWTPWNTCDVTCGTGSETRIRTCNNPAPLNGGRYCSGSTVDVRGCTKTGCPVDGGWTDFQSKDCSVTCGNGVSVKYRTCTNPAPAFGGKDCEGSATSFSACILHECVIDGGWTVWSYWSDCGVVCGDGHQWRNRTCENPSPRYGGSNCTGDNMESSDCKHGLCPTDIKSCYDTEIGTLLTASPFKMDATEAGPSSCIVPNSLQAELLIQKHCHVLSTEGDWELGIQILDHCDKVPLYAPIGLIDKQTKRVKYGILLNCYREYIQIADLSCSDKLEIQNLRLNHLEADYHILFV